MGRNARAGSTPVLATIKIMLYGDYCCWYNPAGYCDCPLVMRKKACKSAIKTKERTENKVVTSKAVNNEDL